jgi:carbonic anhydrase
MNDKLYGRYRMCIKERCLCEIHALSTITCIANTHHILVTISLCIPMSCTEESHDYWSYDDPSEWPKHFPLARGLCQSPIDINTDETVPQFYSPFLFSSKYHSNELFKLTNNSHQVTATLADHTYGQNETDLWFTGGGLTEKFYFVNFHLHWGRTDRHGSEHEINGYPFPAEAHVVFKNNRTGQLAVFAFLFSIADHSHKENKEWRKYADAASELIHTNDTIQCIFNLGQLMQVNERQFFRYMGSLTTPPFSEGVIWTIFTSQIPIKEKSLNELRQNLMRKTYRPIQPINNRTILRNY